MNLALIPIGFLATVQRKRGRRLRQMVQLPLNLMLI